MIIITNAVAHKGAVMIHSHYTLIAHLAMMSSWRLNFLTRMTISELCKLLKLMLIDLSIFFMSINIDCFLQKRLSCTMKSELPR